MTLITELFRKKLLGKYKNILGSLVVKNQRKPNMSYDKRNWQEYNKSLINRGSLTIWIDSNIQKEWVQQGKRGRPKFCSQVIKAGLILKTVYRLAYRSLQGFFQSILQLMQLPHQVPHYSLFSKRAQEVAKEIPKLSQRKPLDLVIDSSGLKVYGEGEWKVKIHGASKRRKWIKAHIAVDPKSQEIVAVEVTESAIGDSKVLPTLVKQSPKSVQRVLADGAYDACACRKYLHNRGIKGLIPPALNGCLRSEQECEERNDALRIIIGLGGDKNAKAIWKKLVGFHKRSLVETAFSKLKRLFGDRLSSLKMVNQAMEVYVRCFVLNKMRTICSARK